MDRHRSKNRTNAEPGKQALEQTSEELGQAQGRHIDNLTPDRGKCTYQVHWDDETMRNRRMWEKEGTGVGHVNNNKTDYDDKGWIENDKGNS